METLDIKKLTPEQLAALQAQMAELESQTAQKRTENISAYKILVDETVTQIAPNLADFATQQNITVLDTFKAFDKALDLKKELYGFKDDQSSHTFTARDGSASICIGHNEVVGFDGTESAGVLKIRNFIKTLAADDANRLVLAGLLETFMKPNKKGELNPTRVAELVAQKDKVNNSEFSEGVDIIVSSQFKTRTNSFVRGWIKRMNENGQEVKLEFSISTR